MAFVVHNYRPGFEMYELLFLLRRVLLAVAFGVVPSEAVSLVVMAITVLFVSLVFVWSPFQSQLENWLDAGSIAVVAVTHSQISSVAEAAELNVAVLATVTVLNLSFLAIVSLVLLVALFRALRGKTKPQLQLVEIS